MKNKLFIILCLILSSTSIAQSEEFQIDYVVDYLVPNKNQVMDTVSVGFAKDGKYLWTNYEGLAKELAGGIGNNLTLQKNASNLIYNSETGKVNLVVKLEGLEMYMGVDIASLLPGANSENSINENVQIDFKSNNINWTIDGKEYPTFDIYADIEPNESFSMGIDISRAVNNTYLFNNFLQLMLKATLSNGTISTKLPNGIILGIKDQAGNEIISAIRVENSTKKISLTNSFKISE